MTTKKKVTKKVTKKVKPEDHGKILAVAKEILSEKKRGIVLICEVVKGKKGLTTTGVCRVHEVPRHVTIVTAMQSFKLDLMEIVAVKAMGGFEDKSTDNK